MAKKDKFKVYILPDIEETDTSDINECIDKKELSNVLKEFKSVLESRFQSCDLITFYNNIRTLKIDEFDFESFNNKDANKPNTLAYYKVGENTIFLPNKNNIGTIYHELFHMSNTFRKSNVLFCGFSQHDLLQNTSIAEGINEGYTQLMAERYFDGSKKGNYSYFVYIMQELERIVGQEKLEEFYIKSDLYGLFNELSNYSHPTDIKDFVLYMDYLVKNMYKKELTREELKKIKVMVLYINKYILMTYINKIEYEGIKSDEEYYEFVDTIRDLIAHTVLSITCAGKDMDVSILNDKKFMKVFKSALNDLDVDFDVTEEKKKTL